MSGPTLSSANRVCWVPFNGDALDDSPNGHDFALINSPSYISGPTSGQALELNKASSEYANIADHGDFDCTGAFTIGAWLKTNDLSADTGLFQKIAGATGIVLYWESAGYWRLQLNNVSTSNPSDSGADLTNADTWAHFVFTRANSTADVLVYKNAGTPVTISASTAVTANTAAAEIGRKFTAQAELDISEFFLFNRAFTSGEISTAYNSGVRLSYAGITWT